jgi:hypothetical protein
MVELEINPGAVVAGKSGTPLKVLAIDADGDLILQKPDLSEVVAKRSAIIEILEPPKLLIGTKVKLTAAAKRSVWSPLTTGQTFFHIGDRVTLSDKFMVRAADVGTVEAITDKGIRLRWDSKSPYEPNLKQPPALWRTFSAAELELVESKYNQN